MKVLEGITISKSWASRMKFDMSVPLSRGITLSLSECAHPYSSMKLASRISLSLCLTLPLLVIASLTASAQQTVTTRAGDNYVPSGAAAGNIAGTYQLSGFDNINLYNGKLNFALPLVTVGGRGGAGYTMALKVNQQWYVDKKVYGPYGCSCGGFNCCHYDTNYSAEATRGDIVGNSNVDAGWSAGTIYGVTAGKDLFASCQSSPEKFEQAVTRLFFRAQDGSTHELRDTVLHGKWTEVGGCSTVPPTRGREFVAVDGSGIRFVADTDIRDLNYYAVRGTPGNLYMRDGTQWRFDSGRVQWIRDRNGNQVTFAYDTNGQLTQVTDSLGRIFTFNGGINFNGFGGAQRTISFRSDEPWLRPDIPASEGQKTTRQLFPNVTYRFDDQGYVPGVLPGPTSVTLPDGRGYRLYYNQYRELARVELPTGGAYEYDWDGWGNNSGIYRRVVERRVYADKNSTMPVQIQTFSVVTPNPPGILGTIIEAKSLDPANRAVVLARSMHYFHGCGSCSLSPTSDPINSRAGENDGREYRTEVFDPATGALLRRTEQTWVPKVTRTFQTSPLINSPEDPLLTKTVATLADANLSATTTYEYDDDLNGTRVTYHPYVATGATDLGTPLRIEEAMFLVNDPTIDAATRDAYRARNMTSLPTSTRVKNGAGTVVAQSEVRYDESALESYAGGIAQWSDPGGTARGNATTSRSWLDTTNGWIETRTEYDQCGNARKSWDAKGNLSQVEYTDSFSDGVGRNTYAFLTRTISSVPDLTGQHGLSSSLVSSTVYDFSTGLVTSATDANGHTTTFNYDDPLNRLKQVTRPTGGGSTSYEYGDAPGNLYVRTQTALDTSRSTDAYQYSDGLGRPTRAYTFDGSSSERTWVATNTEYDSMGRVHRVSDPYFAPDRSGATTPSQWTTTGYDELGRAKTVTTPDNAQVITSYSGNHVTVTDQDGKVRRSTSDALGRLTSVVEAPGVLDHQTDYTYDVLGNLRMVAQGEQRRYFMYDSLSRLIRAKNPEQAANAGLDLTDPVTTSVSWSTAYAYDANGNLTQKADARGVTTTYTYDALNRAQTRTYSDNTPAVTYKYDGAGVSGGVPNSKGNLTLVSSSASSTSYDEYDALGRVKRHTQNTDGQSFQMSYEYDLAGNMISQTYPSGRVVMTGIDQAGRISGITGQKTGEANKTYADSVGYTAHGAISGFKLGNNLWEHTLFNGRLQTVEIGLGTASDGSDKLKLEYGYGAANNNGNVRSQTVTLPGLVVAQSYSYDALNRLQVAQENDGASWKQAFIYDRFGNRRFDQANTTANALGENPDISVANNRIVPRAGEYYRYDAAGNLDRDIANNAYGYDAENRQVSFSGGASYFYDGDGRRVKKVVGAVTTVFVYSAAGQLVAEYTANGAESAAGTSYLTSDKLGSPRLITDQSGNIRARHDYLPFGEELFAGVGGRTAGQGYSQFDGVRQGFTGYEKDGETGLNFAQARYYSPMMGRFTSVDPENAGANSDDPQSWSGYAYGRNNPLLYTDPDGLEYRVCDNNGKCWTHWDPQWKPALKDTEGARDAGVAFKGNMNSGLILDNEGNQIGTYRWVGQDYWSNATNQLMYRELPRRTEPIPRATAAFMGLSIAGGVTGGIGLYGVTSGASIAAAEGAFVNRIGYLSIKQLNNLIHGTQKQALSKLFGGGVEGAKQSLANLKVPPELTRQALLVYRELAQRAIAAGKPPATQIERLKVIEKALQIVK